MGASGLVHPKPQKHQWVPMQNQAATKRSRRWAPWKTSYVQAGMRRVGPATEVILRQRRCGACQGLYCLCKSFDH